MTDAEFREVYADCGPEIAALDLRHEQREQNLRYPSYNGLIQFKQGSKISKVVPAPSPVTTAIPPPRLRTMP
jgi:hypothetical protein